jgi:hypothetical protein
MDTNPPDRPPSEFSARLGPDEEDLDLWSVAVFVWRRKLTIVSVAAVVVLLGLLYVWSRPTVYVAQSTVLVVASPNSVKTVETFAKSARVVGQIRERLEKQGVSWGSDALSIAEQPGGADSQGQPGTVLELSVRGASEPRVGLIVKTWVDVLTHSHDEIDRLRKSPLIDFLSQRYALALRTLTEAQRAQLELLNQQAAAMADLRSRLNIDFNESRLTALQGEAIRLEEQGRALGGELDAARTEEKAYAAELATIPAVMPAAKAVDGRPDLSVPANPAYLETAGELTKARVRVATLGPEQAQTAKRLAEVRTEIARLDAELGNRRRSLRSLEHKQSIERLSADSAVTEAEGTVTSLQQQSIRVELDGAVPTEISSGRTPTASVSRQRRSVLGPLALSVIGGLCLGLFAAWIKAHSEDMR